MVDPKIKNIVQKHIDRFGKTEPSPDDRVLMFTIARSPMYGNPRIGGLADRMKGLMTAYALAVVTNRRFYIRWMDPFPLRRNLEPSAYDWDPARPAQGYLNGAVATRHIDIIDNGAILADMTPRMIEQTLFSDARYVAINANHLRFEPLFKFADLPAPVTAGTAATAELIYSMLFMESANDAFSEQGARFKEFRSRHDTLIGVHLRTGGGNGWNDPVMDDWENYTHLLEQAQALASKNEAQNPGFYFVSDSTKARQAVHALGKPEWLVELEEVSHIDRSSGQQTRDNDLAFYEFQTLRTCDSLISGKGGFAQTAAMTGGKPFVRYTPPPKP